MMATKKIVEPPKNEHPQKAITNILMRILGVFAASGLSVLGAGAVVGIDTIQAVMLAGLLGVATVVATGAALNAVTVAGAAAGAATNAAASAARTAGGTAPSPGGGSSGGGPGGGDPRIRRRKP